METFYDTLGISEEANNDEIESVFRELVKKHHPDTSDSPNSRAKFIRVKTAREVLRDGDERILYDSIGHQAYIENCISKEKWPDVSSLSQPTQTNQEADSTNTPSTETHTTENTVQGQSTIGDYFDEQARKNCGESEGSIGRTAGDHSTQTQESETTTTSTQGETVGGTTQSTANTQSDPDNYWKREAATIGGDQMSEPESSSRKTGDWTQQEQVTEQIPTDGGWNMNITARNYFAKPTILLIYAILNSFAMGSSWILYAARTHHATLTGALQSSFVWGISGTILLLSIIHYFLRQL